MRVLYYIDDLEGDRDLMRRDLAQAGVDCDTAATATAGLQRAQDPAYAAILLDVRLPDMPGEVVAQRLRAVTGGPSLRYRVRPRRKPGPRLPEAVGFPGSQPGRLLWGVTYGNQVVATDWARQVMLAGQTGSGKSTALRSVVAQAIWAGHQGRLVR